MGMLETAIIIVHVLVSLALVALVLLQQGKGAEAGASFGGGASQTVFGSAGSGNFLTKSTSWLAVVFFVTSIALAVIAKQKAEVAASGEEILIPVEQQAAPVPMPVVPEGDISEPVEYDQSLEQIESGMQQDSEGASEAFADTPTAVELESQEASSAVPELE